MARGDDQSKAKVVPPKRNPFRQEIISPEEAEAQKEARAKKAQKETPSAEQKYFQELLEIKEFSQLRLRLMENLSTSISERKGYYLNVLRKDARNKDDQRAVSLYLGDQEKESALVVIQNLMGYLDNQRKDWSVFHEQENLVCLNHFFLANWVRSRGGNAPYMLQEHEGVRVTLDDIVHIDNMMKETAAKIKEILLHEKRPEVIKEVATFLSFLQSVFIKEISFLLEELKENPQALD